MNSNEGKPKFFVIYQITNLLDGRIYVGCHITYNVNDKYMGSSKSLKKDMKEHGRHNFKKDILHIFDNKKDMMNKEAEIVNRDFCHRSDTYNRMVGGINEYTTENMITVINPEGGFMNVYKDDPRWLSGELKGSTTGGSGLRDKMNVDPQLREEFRKRGSDSWKKAHKNGNMKYDNFAGREHKEESKKKIGEANSKIQLGSGNSQFGTCWITKDDQNKKIKKENLDVFLAEGWIKGRI